MNATETQFEAPETTMVREFRAAMDVPGTRDTNALYLKLLNEEIGEFEEGLRNLLKEFTDVHYILEGAAQTAVESGADDISYETAARLQVVHAIGQAIFPEFMRQVAFRRVHESNMSKLGDDGKPVRREDGKVLKGPNYRPVDFTDLVTTRPLVEA